MDHANLSKLTALSPLDGRYREKVKNIATYWSEAGLISARVRVEAKWLIHLHEVKEIEELTFNEGALTRLAAISESVDSKTIEKVKEYERTTNHDVKAVEYALRDELTAAGCSEQELAFIHFACTSEDINNTAYGLMLKESVQNAVLEEQKNVILKIAEIAKVTEDYPMLSRTHGQTASPTTMGKELAVFGHRLQAQYQSLKTLTPLAKMNGAVGNYNAHLSAYPNLNWPEISKDFIESKLGLEYNPLTTQIENHDRLIEICDHLRLWNTISIDLCRDIWSYISLGYFGQKINENEVGSSTMPHKVNPIDFENAEGNFGLSSSLASHFADKLPISRWQRDLSDSTVQRSLGSMFGYHQLALASLMKGLAKLEPKKDVILADLESCFEVLAEPLQTVMRRYGIFDAYERVKKATRGKPIDRESFAKIIQDECSEIDEAERKRLFEITPDRYIGNAKEACAAWCKTITSRL